MSLDEHDDPCLFKLPIASIQFLLADPDNTIDIVFFFITNGTPESMELFVESVEASQGKIQHVLVKNLGASTNIRWQRFDADGKIRAFLAKHEFQSIYFPEILIAPEDKNKILSEYIPWGEALSSDWASFSTKRRLNKCLKEATQALASTGFIPYHAIILIIRPSNSLISCLVFKL